MAMLVKQVGSHIPTIDILFFRSFVGFFFVLPMFCAQSAGAAAHQAARDAFRARRDRRARQCMLLLDADAHAAGRRDGAAVLAAAVHDPAGARCSSARSRAGGASMSRWSASLGILLYARPFTAGFDPGAFVGAAGALAGGLVVICIKRLATTEPTARHHVLLRVLERGVRRSFRRICCG